MLLYYSRFINVSNNYVKYQHSFYRCIRKEYSIMDFTKRNSSSAKILIGINRSVQCFLKNNVDYINPKAIDNFSGIGYNHLDKKTGTLHQKMNCS